jgi:hypothetical protein
MHETATVELDGFKFEGVFDPQRPDRPAMVLLSSALQVLGFIRRDPADTSPPLTHTVIVIPTGGSVYEAYAAEVVDIPTVREAVKTKQKLLEEWRTSNDE